MLWVRNFFLAWNWTEVIVEIVADLGMDFHLLSDIILIKVSLQTFFVILCTELQTIIGSVSIGTERQWLCLFFDLQLKKEKNQNPNQISSKETSE